MARTLKATDPKAAKPSKPKMLVFGKPKVGKSWMAIEWPDVYYIDVEAGVDLDHYREKLVKACAGYLSPENGANDFDTVIEEVITLATTKHRYKTLVIDSFSHLFNTQIAKTAEAMEKAGEKIAFANDRRVAIAKTRRLMRWIDLLQMNVLFICHEKATWKDGEQIGVTFDGWEKLEYILHLAVNVFKQGGSRKARVTATRLLQFPDAAVFDWSFDEFANRYGRDVIFEGGESVALATVEQVQKYKYLMGLVKLDPKVSEKWEENADEPSDMTTADLQKRIDFLEAKRSGK